MKSKKEFLVFLEIFDKYILQSNFSSLCKD